jgi:choline dehydrogenase
VEKVIFDDRRATGVRAHTADGCANFDGAEVLLCAGAVYSPAILMRSGVGPADHLRDFAIDVLQDLPVGCGLNEHPSIELELLLKEPAAKVTDKYALSCLVRFSSGLAGAGPNDMGFGSFNLFDPGEGDRAQGTILLTLFRSFSRGSVRLRSTRPDIDPAIEFNMLSDDRDIGRMRDGVTRLFELASHPAVKSIAR